MLSRIRPTQQRSKSSTIWSVVHRGKSIRLAAHQGIPTANEANGFLQPIALCYGGHCSAKISSQPATFRSRIWASISACWSQVEPLAEPTRMASLFAAYHKFLRSTIIACSYRSWVDIEGSFLITT
jgi:hypothetical protein